jgi:hypothetical protein
MGKRGGSRGRPPPLFPGHGTYTFSPATTAIFSEKPKPLA